jgi:hypothetical protein
MDPTTPAATRRCDLCGHSKPSAAFKPRPTPDQPDQRDSTCRECTRGSWMIKCEECGFARRTRSHRTRFCFLCALRRKLAATKSLARCHRCKTKFAPLHPKDRECVEHHDFNRDRITWAFGQCLICKNLHSGGPGRIWSVDVPVCPTHLKSLELRNEILGALSKALTTSNVLRQQPPEPKPARCPALRGDQLRDVRQKALALLRAELAHGERKGRDVKAAAEEAGVTAWVLRWARKEAGVVIAREGIAGEHRSIWSLRPASVLEPAQHETAG